MSMPLPNVEAIAAAVHALEGDVKINIEQNGVLTAWVRLPRATGLPGAATAMKSIGARFAMATAMRACAPNPNAHLIAYHFDVAGSTVTIEVGLTSGEAVPSIDGAFRNADWHEREFMELYDIRVAGRAGAPRLFLDESIDAAVFDRLIPLSTLANAASTKRLWERISEAKEHSA